MAEPSAMIISAPSSNKEITIGINHHFLRTLRNCQNSTIIDNLLTVTPITIASTCATLYV